MTVGDFARNGFRCLRDDGIGAAVRYAGRELHAGSRYRLSAFRNLGEDYLTLSFGTLTVELRMKSKTERSHYRNVMSERWLLEDVVERIRPTDTFWDVGGNIGLYSCTVGQLCEQVVAVEPFDKNRHRLGENLATNGVATEHLYPYAMADVDEEREFFVDPRDEAGAGHGSLEHASPDADVERVTCRRGDRLVEEGVPAPDVIKIDVEGAEAAVLEGMSETLSSGDVRVVYCEVHSPDWRSIGDRLEEHRFDVQVLDVDESRSFIRAERRDVG
jgi:FkbM family methyltransferase